VKKVDEMKGSKTLFRIALANLRFPATPEESVALAEQAITQASRDGAGYSVYFA
jgi:hypothetical protein